MDSFFSAEYGPVLALSLHDQFLMMPVYPSTFTSALTYAMREQLVYERVKIDPVTGTIYFLGYTDVNQSLSLWYTLPQISSDVLNYSEPVLLTLDDSSIAKDFCVTHFGI